MSLEELDDVLADLWPELAGGTWNEDAQQDSSPDQAPQWQQPQPEQATQPVFGWPNAAPEPVCGAVPPTLEGIPLWPSAIEAIGLPDNASGDWPQNAQAMQGITASQLQQPQVEPASQQMFEWSNTNPKPGYDGVPLIPEGNPLWPSTIETMGPPVDMSGNRPQKLPANNHYHTNMTPNLNHFTSLPRHQDNTATLPVHYNPTATLPVLRHHTATLPVQRNYETNLPVNQNNPAYLPVNHNNGPCGVYGASHSLAGPARNQHTPVSNQVQSMQVSQNKINPTEVTNSPRFNITITPNGIARKILKRKRVRTAFTTDQILALERVYSKQVYVSKDERQVLTERLKISDRAIKVWFQNRRMKGKREVSDKYEAESTDPDLIEVPTYSNNSNSSTCSDVEPSSFSFPNNLTTVGTVATQENVVYEPISPADTTNSAAEDGQWQAMIDDEDFQELFDKHFC